MQKLVIIVSVAMAAALFVMPAAAQGQSTRGDYGYGYGMGPGMMGGYGPGYGYGYGYGMGPGMMGGWGWVEVPSTLPKPKNAEWVQKLREIFAMEKHSLAQYEADHEKFNVYMPYMMVIPQEENHIEWITEMFEAYGLKADVATPPITDNKTLTQAYELSAKLENDLLPRYEWLVKNAGDRVSAGALNTILIQSRWHLVMFDHALRMGESYGYGMGPGMMGGYGRGYGYGRGSGRGYGRGYGYGMGPGMMGDYGYGTGRGYNRQAPSTVKPMDSKEAEAMMKDYLKSSRNPNLRLGKIKDAGSDFEAEIRTRNNTLVDRVLIDKNTGYIRSAY